MTHDIRGLRNNDNNEICRLIESLFNSYSSYFRTMKVHKEETMRIKIFYILDQRLETTKGRKTCVLKKLIRTSRLNDRYLTE